MCLNLSVGDFARASHGAEVVLKNKTVPFWSVPLHAAAVAHGAGHAHYCQFNKNSGRRLI